MRRGHLRVVQRVLRVVGQRPERSPHPGRDRVSSGSPRTSRAPPAKRRSPRRSHWPPPSAAWAARRPIRRAPPRTRTPARSRS